MTSGHARADAETRIFQSLGLDTSALDPEQDRLMILRHPLMNSYLIDHQNGISYIDGHFDFLKRCIRALRGITV